MNKAPETVEICATDQHGGNVAVDFDYRQYVFSWTKYIRFDLHTEKIKKQARLLKFQSEVLEENLQTIEQRQARLLKFHSKVLEENLQTIEQLQEENLQLKMQVNDLSFKLALGDNQ